MGAIVVKVSGHAMDGPLTATADYLAEFSASIARLCKVFEVAVTIGAGQRARELIQLAKHFESRDVAASMIGGDIGLAHCRVLAAALRSANVQVKQPIESWSHAADEMASGSVPILYGYWPGMTSDAVAAYFADYVGAHLVLKLSKIDAIYNCDPSIDGARPLRSVSHEQLEEMAVREDRRIAGSGFVVDLLAARRLKESRIPLLLGHMSNVEGLVGWALDPDSEPPVRGTLVSSSHES